jgi:hypothetical protein
MKEKESKITQQIQKNRQEIKTDRMDMSFGEILIPLSFQDGTNPRPVG